VSASFSLSFCTSFPFLSPCHFVSVSFFLILSLCLCLHVPLYFCVYLLFPCHYQCFVSTFFLVD
jgi:hypothetical protein